VEGAVAIVLAAGSGERLGSSVPKAFVGLGGRPMLARAVASALACPAVDAVVVAAPVGSEDLVHAALEPFGTHAVVTGGESRQASVRAALGAIPEGVRIVVCHDAARPLATPALFSAVIAAIGTSGADGAVPVVPVADTVKRVRGGAVVGTEPREELGLAQTPQAFRTSALRDAHARAEAAGATFTDDAAVLEWAGYHVVPVDGEPSNFKITTVEDLARAERMLAEVLP
jgi:2-C-methyl-D-erythritol 4-phosphate cytidylyltransferase/2-C-methyl-D-erythritol 2,4-cyclodiphosphate synthase